MKSNKYLLTLCAGAILIIFAACNRPASTPTVQPEAGLVFTAAALTVEAQVTELAENPRPTPTPLPQPATAAPNPTAPPASTEPTSTPDNSAEPTGQPEETACNQARFVEDVTIPDGTLLDPGETFQKTWRLQNTGSCSWDSAYFVVFVDGDAMGGPASQALSGSIASQDEVEITVEMVAPDEPGTYRGNWSLRNPAGEVFGVGEDGQGRFWVEIEVPGPTEEPEPAFSLSYHSVQTCSGQQTLVFELENSGNVEFESAEITITNSSDNSGVFGPETINAFILDDPDDCPPGKERLRLNKLKYTGVAPPIFPDAGTSLQAKVKLCVEENLGGVCLERTTDFTSP